MRYVGTRNPRAEHNPLRSLPLLRPAAGFFGPSATDLLVGDLRRALYARAGWATSYAAACRKLGWANATRREHRRLNQADAMRALNAVRKQMRANTHAIAALTAELLEQGVSPADWAIAGSA